MIPMTAAKRHGILIFRLPSIGYADKSTRSLFSTAFSAGSAKRPGNRHFLGGLVDSLSTRVVGSTMRRGGFSGSLETFEGETGGRPAHLGHVAINHRDGVGYGAATAARRRTR